MTKGNTNIGKPYRGSDYKKVSIQSQKSSDLYSKSPTNVKKPFIPYKHYKKKSSSGDSNNYSRSPYYSNQSYTQSTSTEPVKMDGDTILGLIIAAPFIGGYYLIKYSAIGLYKGVSYIAKCLYDLYGDNESSKKNENVHSKTNDYHGKSSKNNLESNIDDRVKINSIDDKI